MLLSPTKCPKAEVCLRCCLLRQWQRWNSWCNLDGQNLIKFNPHMILLVIYKHPLASRRNEQGAPGDKVVTNDAEMILDVSVQIRQCFWCEHQIWPQVIGLHARCIKSSEQRRICEGNTHTTPENKQWNKPVMLGMRVFLRLTHAALGNRTRIISLCQCFLLCKDVPLKEGISHSLSVDFAFLPSLQWLVLLSRVKSMCKSVFKQNNIWNRNSDS